MRIVLDTNVQLPRKQVEIVLHQLRTKGYQAPAHPGLLRLPDQDDVPFPDAALASMADALVTGNSRHYPPEDCHGMRVLTPAEFTELWQGSYFARRPKVLPVRGNVPRAGSAPCMPSVSALSSNVGFTGAITHARQSNDPHPR